MSWADPKKPRKWRREWSLRILETGETRTCHRLWPILVSEFVPGRVVRAYWCVRDIFERPGV